MKSSIVIQNTLQLEYISSKGLEMKIILYIVLISEASESIFSWIKNVSLTLQDNGIDNEKMTALERSIPENFSLLMIAKNWQ
jgi:hypothetical protein